MKNVQTAMQNHGKRQISERVGGGLCSPARAAAALRVRSTPHVASVLRVASVLLAVLAGALGCAAENKPAKHAHDRDTLVPQETQRKSEQLYGEQELQMQNLNASTADQAASAHESAVGRSQDVQRERRRKR